MEVEENQWVVVHKYAAILFGNLVILDVPWSGIAALVPDHFGVRRDLVKPVEITLVATAVALWLSETPFQAAVAPPFQAGGALICSAESNPADIVTAKSL